MLICVINCIVCVTFKLQIVMNRKTALYEPAWCAHNVVSLLVFHIKTWIYVLFGSESCSTNTTSIQADMYTHQNTFVQWTWTLSSFNNLAIEAHDNPRLFAFLREP